MYRTLGRYAKQAYGINKDLLDKMIDATDDSLRGIRDRAILLVAYDSLCRRSELVSLEFEDLAISSKDGSLKLKLRKSKTDPHATGRWLYLTVNSQEALKDWVTKSQIKSGRLFRSIFNDKNIKESLNPAQINRIFKKYAYSSKIDTEIIKGISGHSMRIGGAQDLMLCGASIPIIMNRGRWSKIDTAMRYLEHSNKS
jgi:integrase